MTKQGWYAIGLLAVIGFILFGIKIALGQEKELSCLPISYTNTFLEHNELKRYAWLKNYEDTKFVLTLKNSTQEWLLLLESKIEGCLIFNGKGFVIDGSIDELMDMRDAQND